MLFPLMAVDTVSFSVVLTLSGAGMFARRTGGRHQPHGENLVRRFVLSLNARIR